MRYKLRLFRILAIIFVAVAAGVGSNEAEEMHDEVKAEEMPVPEELPPEIIIEERGYPLSEVPLIRTSLFVNLTYEEMDLLEGIAMAEASGEDTVGKALVMRVVLNRSLRDGKSIKEVIYSPGQFYVKGMSPGDDGCHEALAMVIEGWDESEGALYFCSSGYSRYGKTHLFQHGNHYFSK